MWTLLEKKSFKITLFIIVCLITVVCTVINRYRGQKYGNITTFREYSDRCGESLPTEYTLVQDGENYAIRTKTQISYSFSADSIIKDTIYYYLMDDFSSDRLGDPAMSTDSCVMKARALYHYYTYRHPFKSIEEKYNFSPL